MLKNIVTAIVQSVGNVGAIVVANDILSRRDSRGRYFTIDTLGSSTDLATDNSWKVVTCAGEAILARHISKVDKAGFTSRKGKLLFTSKGQREKFNAWYDRFQTHQEYMDNYREIMLNLPEGNYPAEKGLE